MATVVYCDPDVLGREQRINKRGILGGESPLEFEDGHALVEDEDAAALLVRRIGVIQYAGSGGNDGDPDYFEDAEDGDGEEAEDFDAEAFVDRTPMGDVVEDIESGEYDDHLDAIEAAAERQGVQDAVDDRRG